MAVRFTGVMKTYFQKAIVLFSCALTLHAIADGEQTSEKPIVIETKIGAAKIQILETEEEANSRYEKWQEKRLVLFGLVMPSTKNRTFVTQEIEPPTLTLLIQANEKKADFDKRWDQLKTELADIKSAKSKLKTWDISQPVSEIEVTIPAQTFHENLNAGYVSYAWATRTIEMEGVHIGKKTMFKATITFRTDGPIAKPLEGGRIFDMETGEVVYPKSN